MASALKDWVRLRRWPLAAAGGIVLLALGAFFEWNRPSHSRFPVRGIDVSHHQGAIDWKSVGSAGIDFAFIKATEGGDFLDTRFQENWADSLEAGIARGAYHFFTFCTSGPAQADHFLEVVPPVDGTLPPGVDVEFAGNCRSWTTIAGIRRELAVFLERLEDAWGRRPILYITSESKERIIQGHFDDYPIWIRSTFLRPGGRNPTWLFWQHSDDGEVPGIDTPVDLNVYRGPREDFAALAR